METVLLKSKVGPTKIRHGDPNSQDRQPEFVADFSLENDCRAKVPEWWWEQMQGQPFDRNLNLTYREAFFPL